MIFWPVAVFPVPAAPRIFTARSREPSTNSTACEAGMVSGRQMAELLNLAEQQAARIVFSGDTRQIQSVEAADALRILE